MNVEDGAGFAMREGLFQLFDQSGRWNNNGKRSKWIVGLAGPDILDKGLLKDWMKRPGDDAKHI